MFNTYEDLMEVEAACEALHMSRNCLYALLKSGDLKGFQQGRIWKIPKQAIIEYISEKSGLKPEHCNCSITAHLVMPHQR